MILSTTHQNDPMETTLDPVVIPSKVNDANIVLLCLQEEIPKTPQSPTVDHQKTFVLEAHERFDAEGREQRTEAQQRPSSRRSRSRQNPSTQKGNKLIRTRLVNAKQPFGIR